MRSLPRSAIALIVVLGALMLLGANGPSTASAIEVEPVIWQLDEDYPAAIGPDVSLPISTVYIKTHDGTDWMSTYDSNPKAVSGPDSIRSLIQEYAAQGIEVSAWFVPKGLNFDRQVQMAVQVIDTGVKALYADLEPFQGFCFRDCSVLADQFWNRVRAERPNAHLGVIYDPRPWWWDQSATSKWFSVANSALPMCYWESYIGQIPWNDPAGCVFQAHSDLGVLAPGRHLEYVPMLQGNTHASRFLQALDAAVVAGATRVSVWRRGVTGNDIWGLVSSYQELEGPRCENTLVDGCLVREATQQAVYLVIGGARFSIPSANVFNGMGLDWRRVQVVPTGFVAQIPAVPRDGTLIREHLSGAVYVVYGGGFFSIPSPEQFHGMGFRTEDIREIPTGGLGQIPHAPRDYTRVQELGSSEEHLFIHGAHMPLDDLGRQALSYTPHADAPRYTIPAGSLSWTPVLRVPRGDSDCDGILDTVDAIDLLAYSSNLRQPGPCTHLVGDLDCDGGASPQDAFISLRFLAGVAFPVSSCAAVGSLQPVQLPGVPPAPLPPSVATPAPTPVPSAAPVTTPTPTSDNPVPTATPTQVATPTETTSASPTPGATISETPTPPAETQSPTPLE
jgi:hypothetical protein